MRHFKVNEELDEHERMMLVSVRGSTGESEERRQSPCPTGCMALLFCPGTLNVNLWPEV